MAKNKKQARPKARLPKGLRDIQANELRATEAMVSAIRAVYERYGFEPLETPAFEYTDALGKFLPDVERPNAGVFSFQDEDDAWMSLRYDLTAPLARYVAENFDAVAKPFRRYATGPVWRNEKPGPGRYRQFTQFDADTVGTDNVAADAEMCMLAAETLEALGIDRGSYIVRVNNRKVLDGVLALAGLGGEQLGGGGGAAANDGGSDDDAGAALSAQRLTVLRALDKFDRLGADGVRLLLGAGRKDDSGDFTKGANLSAAAADTLLAFVSGLSETRDATLDALADLVGENQAGAEGVRELRTMSALLDAAGFGADRVVVDPSVVRGLEYYTGPVFEAELTFEVRSDDGQLMRFGSVGGGGRYDNLVSRFTGRPAPATGFSIGVSRLQSALAALGSDLATVDVLGPVVVLVMDDEGLPRAQNITNALRSANIRAEMYLGTAGMKAQMKYADKRSAPCVVIEGPDERAAGEVQIKDLIQGIKMSETITDAQEWREGRPAQFSVPADTVVAAVADVLARYQT